MTITVNNLAETLHTVFTTEAEKAAKDSGMIQRQRRITGPSFVQTLVFGWLDNPDATIEDLGLQLGVSKQGLDQRFDPRAADCLWQVVTTATKRLFAAAPEAIPMVRRFSDVTIDDCTSLGLPAALAQQFPGCGGSHPEAGKAALKLLVRFNVTTGEFQAIERGAGRESDRTLAKRLPSLSSGSLHLADLGFFDLDELSKMTAQKVSWISRVPALLHKEAIDGTTEALTDWLKQAPADRIDQPVRLGTKKSLNCRLVALRLPRKVAQERLRELKKKLKKKGRTLSERQRVLCEWLVLMTDLPTDQFSLEDIFILYRVRWQIELLFKRWKSLARLGQSHGRRAYRILCETYAKLLGSLVQHWSTLLRGGPLSRISVYKRAKKAHEFAARIAATIADPVALLVTLRELAARLERIRSRSKSRRRPTTRQLLFGARLKY